MDESPYSFSTKPIEIDYTFESVSATKTVRKVVRLTEMNLFNTYNLALLDVLNDGLESDLSVTNNDDLRTVLATVMHIISNFLTKFPEKVVTFSGSDERRTRLYRIVINQELDTINKRFEVFGQLNTGQLKNFQPTTNYHRFFVRLKP